MTLFCFQLYTLNLNYLLFILAYFLPDKLFKGLLSVPLLLNIPHVVI
jgi:hypothetical protein